MNQRPAIWKHRTVVLLGILILIGGLCKTAVLFTVQRAEPTRIFVPDSDSYVNTAFGLLQTGRFVVSPENAALPQLERTPGYPLFVAGIFFLVGPDYSVLMITQILLSLGTILLTYFMAKALWKKDSIALIAACFLSLDPLSFVHSQQVITETLFTFFLSASLLTGLRFTKKTNVHFMTILCSGMLFSLATLIRPIAYYAIIPLLILFAMIWKTVQRWSWKTTVIMLMVFMIPWLILVGGWQFRNYHLTGSAEFSSIQGVNLLFYRGAGIVAQQQGCTFEEARHLLGYDHYLRLKSDPETTGATLARWSREWKQEGLRLICQYPWLYLRDQIQGAFRLLFETDWNMLPAYLMGASQNTSGPVGDVFRLPLPRYLQVWFIERPRDFVIFLMSASYLVLLYSGVMMSLWSLFKLRHTSDWLPHVFLGVMLLYFIGISAGPEAYSRFRVPIMPLLCVYGGDGVYRMIGWMTHLNMLRRVISSPHHS